MLTEEEAVKNKTRANSRVQRARAELAAAENELLDANAALRSVRAAKKG